MSYCPNCGTAYQEPPLRCQCGYLFGQQAAAFTQAPSGDTGTLEFLGSGFALLGLYLKMIALSIVTIGVYSFWGRAEIRRYTMSNLRFAQQEFEFHGTGKELFLGWLKLVCFFVIGYSLIGILMLLKLGPPEAFLVLWLVVLALLAPVAIHGAIRYRWSRTSWQGRRFSYTGDLMELAWVVWPGFLLTLITLGIYLPNFLTNLRRYITTHSSYGGHTFEFDGDAKDLRWATIKMILLFIPTLGIYRFFYQAKLQNYFWNHTSYAGSKFVSRMSGWDLLILGVANYMTTVFTLGIGYPWTICRNVRYLCENLMMPVLPMVELTNAAAAEGSAFGDTLGAELGTDAGIDAGFGV